MQGDPPAPIEIGNIDMCNNTAYITGHGIFVSVYLKGVLYGIMRETGSDHKKYCLEEGYKKRYSSVVDTVAFHGLAVGLGQSLE